MRYYGEGERQMTTQRDLPPQNLDAERGVLGACLIHNPTIDDVSEFLRPEDFYRDSHEGTFREIVRIYNTGPVDAGILAEHLIRKNLFDLYGGDEFLEKLLLSVPHAANAVYHARIVQEKAKLRRLIEASQEAIHAAYANAETADEIIGKAQNRLFEVAADDNPDSVVDFEGLLDRAMSILAIRRTGEVIGVSTGFDDLDDIIGGFRPGQMIIVAARPGMGKTAFAMGVAINAGKLSPVLMNSMEMSNDELALRFLSILSGVDSYNFNDARYLSAEEDALLYQAHELHRKLRIKSDDRPSRSITQIAAGARRMKARDGLSLLIVDYLSLMGGSRHKGESRQEEVARNSTALKGLAKELSVPIMVLAQLNRKNEDRGDKRPQLSDLRESGQIEQDADVVILLHRPDYYDPTDKPGIVEAIIAKNRNGRTKPVELQFTKECTRFASLPRYHEAPPVTNTKPF